MSAFDAMITTGYERGWTVNTQLDLAMRYIEGQGNNQAFYEFLSEVVKDEDAGSYDKEWETAYYKAIDEEQLQRAYEEGD